MNGPLYTQQEVDLLLKEQHRNTRHNDLDVFKVIQNASRSIMNLPQRTPKTILFYRVANNKTKQGLWYDVDGNYTGLIHNEFNFCTNSDLPMPFDKDLCGWLSATDKLETLYHWFTKEDILELQRHSYYITLYKAFDSKEYKNHWIINQQSSIIVDEYILYDDGVLEKR